MHHSIHFINNRGFECSLWSWDASSSLHEFTRQSIFMFVCSLQVWVQWFSLGVFGLGSALLLGGFSIRLELLSFSPVLGLLFQGFYGSQELSFSLVSCAGFGYSGSSLESFSFECSVVVWIFPSLFGSLWWFLLCSIKFFFHSLEKFVLFTSQLYIENFLSIIQNGIGSKWFVPIEENSSPTPLTFA